MPPKIAGLRDSLKSLPQVAASSATSTPDLRTIFTPLSHGGALDPSREIVVGDRGVGKSFWSSVLKDDTARNAIASVYPKLKLSGIKISLGFSETLASQTYPSSRVIGSLLASNIEPDLIWRSVILNATTQHGLPANWASVLIQNFLSSSRIEIECASTEAFDGRQNVVG